MSANPRPIAQLGLRANAAQFTLLVAVNALVGAVVGTERSILPAIAADEFQLSARAAMLSFIAVFGLTKAIANYAGGRLADRYGRKSVLVAGWIAGLPVPFMLMWAGEWRWILAANALLGISQGLTWSMTVLMKIDLVGGRQRGLAMGLNEFAGYVAVALSAWATGWIASHYGLRPSPFYLGVACTIAGLLTSVLAVRDTSDHVERERLETAASRPLPAADVFWRTTVGDRTLSSITQAGIVNNLNDAMAWGLFPLVFAAARLDLARIGLLAAIYPAAWGISQLVTGAWSDRIGRKGLIVGGMVLQAIAIGIVAVARDTPGFALGAVLLGLGTAAVYPTLLAAIGDVAGPSWRGAAIGVYRFWRDLGYALGALLAGLTADLIGLQGALWLVAALTLMSGVVAGVRMRETRQPLLVPEAT
jgi:MFS family permease